jgi:hypothetical protein
MQPALRVIPRPSAVPGRISANDHHLQAARPLLQRRTLQSSLPSTLPRHPGMVK